MVCDKHDIQADNLSRIWDIIPRVASSRAQPEHDPHIIEYSAADIILLDIIKRKQKFETLSQSHRQEFAKKYGFTCKQKAMQIESLKRFEDWIEHIDTIDYQFEGRYVKGFVVEDACGFQFKIKLGIYAFWKQMRTGYRHTWQEKQYSSIVLKVKV